MQAQQEEIAMLKTQLEQQSQQMQAHEHHQNE
jgi:hypothetical protein